MLSHSAWPHRVSPSVTNVITTGFTAQSEESGIEAGPIATITGSLSSCPGNDLFDSNPFGSHHSEHYDTDHTDLASEPDEAELRRELLRDVRE